MHCNLLNSLPNVVCLGRYWAIQNYHLLKLCNLLHPTTCCTPQLKTSVGWLSSASPPLWVLSHPGASLSCFPSLLFSFPATSPQPFSCPHNPSGFLQAGFMEWSPVPFVKGSFMVGLSVTVNYQNGFTLSSSSHHFPLPDRGLCILMAEDKLYARRVFRNCSIWEPVSEQLNS